MAKILLVQAPPWGISAPPLGIAYLATFLKSRGFPVEIFDLNIEIYRNCSADVKAKWDTQDFEFWASGKALEAFSGKVKYFADRIISFDPEWIGFSATFASVPFLNALIGEIKSRTGAKPSILVGGAGISFREVRSLFRKDLIEFFIAEEGEFALFDLLKCRQKGVPISNDSGYATWKDEPQDYSLCLKIKEEGRQHVDDIPFPTFEEFNLDLYTQADLVPLISSRGCIRSCAFCCDAPLKKPYRSRSPEKVAAELRYHVARYKRRRFEFCDLLINGDLDFLNRFCDILIDMGLGVCWGGQATIRRDMPASLFKKMKQAGCGGLTFGCESFSDRVLQLMRKGITSREIRDTFVKAKEAGMLVEINLIVGFPGENEDDIARTIDFLRENHQWIDKVNSLNICTIGPGMHVFEHLEEYNIDKALINDWYAWFTKDMSNTLQVRTRRHEKISAVCSEFNLRPAWQNIKR